MNGFFQRTLSKSIHPSKKWLIPSGIIIVILLVVILSAFYLGKEETIVLTVNDEPVSRQEFQIRLNKVKADVFSYFYNKYGEEESKDFWTKSFNGEVPIEMAKKRALDACAKIKVQQILARRKGLVEDISYNKFLQDLQKENDRRKKAASKNQVIYGPIQYTEDTYFDYLFSNRVIQLKEDLAKKELSISDQVLTDKYVSLKDPYYKNEYIKIHRISISYGSKLEAQTANQKVEEAAKLINSGKTFDEVAKLYNPNGDFLELVIDENNIKNIRKYNPSLFVAASNLTQGKVSPIIDENNSVNLLYCLERKFIGYKSFDEVKDALKNSILDEQYDQYIKQLVNEANVEINEAIYRRIQF